MFLCNSTVFHCLALLFAQLLAQAIFVNYVVDKKNTDIIQFRFTVLNKKFNIQKKLKTLQNQLNFTFLHLKLTIGVLKIITLLGSQRSSVGNMLGCGLVGPQFKFLGGKKNAYSIYSFLISSCGMDQIINLRLIATVPICGLAG